jgi:UDP-N-acetylmuramoyl-tripeptide--D-alanyl-D-alanine ligase
MGMRGLGQIAELCEIAKPQIGIVTSIGPVHLELMGTVERVAQAKAEIVGSLPAGGVAIAPTPAPELEPYLARDDVELLRFGPGGDIVVAEFEAGDRYSEVAFERRGRRLELRFNFTSRHQAGNAAAALLAYEALGLPLDRAHEGATGIAFSRWRGEELPLDGGGLLINDSYNANPMSMRAALEHLADRAGRRRRVAVLGDMAELGPGAAAYHREVGAAASRAGVDVLLAVGPLARSYLEGARGVPVTRWAPTVEQGLGVLRQLLQPGDCVLVKGSRAMGLEAIGEAVAVVPA